MVVTLRPSRAWVHSDCSVYIALPTPTMQITLRSGQATAAPVATGVENPIEPPMFCSQSWGAAAAVGGKKARPVVMDSSTTIAFSGIAMAMAWAIEACVSAPVGLVNSTWACGLASTGFAPSAEAGASTAATEFLPPEGSHGGFAARSHAVDLAALRLEQARLVGIGKKRNRIVGFDQNDVPEILQNRQRLLDDVGNAVDRKTSAAPRHTRVVGLTHYPAAGLARDLRRQREPVFGQRGAREQQQRLGAASQYLGGIFDRLRRVAGALGLHRHLGDAIGLVPGGIGRQDQRRNLWR